MGLKQEAGPEGYLAGERRTIKWVKATQIKLLFSCGVQGLQLFGQVGSRAMVVDSH